MPGTPTDKKRQSAQRMDIDTYFGFFARSVLTAIGASLATQTGQSVTLHRVDISTTNTIKLRLSDVDTVLLPTMAERSALNFVLALSERDLAGLNRLAAGRAGLQSMMEQAVGSAVEPLNFITRRRNRMSALRFSRNVTGLTAHHLGGEVSYTLATGHFQSGRGQGFALRLLVTPAGRDLIEERATQASTQRALFSINEGAYLCRPQWEPPPPPPGLEQGADVSQTMMNGWLQTFFGLNDGITANKLFQRPVGLVSMLTNVEALHVPRPQEPPPTVVRLQIDDQTALELFVVLRGVVARSLLRMSRSGQDRFLGDLFRVVFSESAQLWERFAETPLRWRLLAVRPIPHVAMDMVSDRLKDGGLVVRQVAALDEGHLEWKLAIPPHTWHWLMRLTAKGMSLPSGEIPNRQTIFAATGWSQGRVPWARMLGFLTDRELQDLVRVFQQARLQEGTLAAVTGTLDGASRERWLEAMPVMLRERTLSYPLGQGEGPRRLAALTQSLIPLNRARKLGEGRLSQWMALYTEFFWSYRQYLIDSLLPFRHLVYGLDRGSLSRLLFDMKSSLLVEALSWAEFPVVDQVRRAISPGFTVRLLEDIAVLRTRLSAFSAQEAQLEVYRACHSGMIQGRYLLRPTPAERLRELFRLLEEE